jgi:hypothetical protein
MQASILIANRALGRVFSKMFLFFHAHALPSIVIVLMATLYTLATAIPKFCGVAIKAD